MSSINELIKNKGLIEEEIVMARWTHNKANKTFDVEIVLRNLNTINLASFKEYDDAMLAVAEINVNSQNNWRR